MTSVSEPQLPTGVGARVANVYAIERELGRGQRAVVFGVTRIDSGKPLALRFWLHDAERAAAGSERFRQRARTRELFDHPHIVELFEHGQLEGSHYAVTEWLSGSSLERVLRRSGCMSWSQLRPLLLPCLEALASAHGAGIVHGRISPANVFVCAAGPHAPERARLINWEYGDVAISPMELDGVHRPYLAPELVQGSVPSARSDVYGAGVLLYRALSGTWPHGSVEVSADAGTRIARQIEPLQRRVPQLSAAVADCVERALSDDPRLRHADVCELVAELASVGAPRVDQQRWIKPVTSFAAGLELERPREPVAATSSGIAPWTKLSLVVVGATLVGSLAALAAPTTPTAQDTPLPVEMILPPNPKGPQPTTDDALIRGTANAREPAPLPLPAAAPEAFEDDVGAPPLEPASPPVARPSRGQTTESPQRARTPVAAREDEPARVQPRVLLDSMRLQ